MSLAQKKPLPYDVVEPFVENMALVSKDGMFGFINRAYQERIPLQYSIAFDFSEGVAAVLISDSLHDEWIFIDSTGKQAVPGKYSYINYSFVDGLAVVSVDGEKYVINKKGERVIKPQDNWVLPFRHGLALVSESSTTFGVVNLKGKTVIPIQYGSIEILSPKLVRVTTKDGRDGLLTSTGKQIAAMKYDRIEQLKNGLISVSLEEKYGLLDKEGKTLIEPRYSWIKDFEEGLAAVERNEKWGFIDESGKEVVAARYDQVSSFLIGKSEVKVGDKTYYIDKKGNQVDEDYNDIGIPVQGISQQVAEGNFLRILNKLVTDYPYINNEGEAVMSDSAFVIRNGLLVGTFKEQTAEGLVLTKMSAPVAKIQAIWYDYNMGFDVDNNNAFVQTSKPGSVSYDSGSPTDGFQLATPGDGAHGMRVKEQLRLALKALKKFYP
jgi:hypothetical protein